MLSKEIKNSIIKVIKSNKNCMRKIEKGIGQISIITLSGSANYWWLRSPHYNNSNNFCRVNSNGNVNNNTASNSNGVAPGFHKI